MSYFTSAINQQIEKTFLKHDLTVEVGEDHFIVKNSHNETTEKIIAIIESALFCPLMSPHRINGDLAFSITPYPIPEAFQPQGYFTHKQISNLLASERFVRQEYAVVNDKWQKINDQREIITQSLNLALDDIITKHANNDLPIVEIGAGAGYDLSSPIAARTIRIQPSNSDCKALSRFSSDPIYSLSIEKLHERLLMTGKKIALFFALNVFDTMTAAEREVNLSRISDLQNQGDRLLIMLDTNPLLDLMFDELKQLYPNDTLAPYLPLNRDCCKLSLLRLPKTLYQNELTNNELFTELNFIATKLTQNMVSFEQFQFHKWQEEHDLEVIVLEDYFADHMKAILSKIGYESKVYYHARFTQSDNPRQYQNLTEDIIYKSVTDTLTVRQWSFEDVRFKKWLASKDLQPTPEWTPAFIQNIKETGNKLLGAEILVIEATKL